VNADYHDLIVNEGIKEVYYLRLSAKICVLLRINEILDFVPEKKYIESICASQPLPKDSTCEVNNDGPEL